jgi:hypothetical protein
MTLHQPNGCEVGSKSYTNALPLQRQLCESRPSLSLRCEHRQAVAHAVLFRRVEAPIRLQGRRDKTARIEGIPNKAVCNTLLLEIRRRWTAGKSRQLLRVLQYRHRIYARFLPRFFFAAFDFLRGLSGGVFNAFRSARSNVASVAALGFSSLAFFFAGTCGV